MKKTSTTLAACCIGVALLAAPVAADDVYLVNGKVYQGVVAEWVASGLRIHLPFGRITVPRDQVLEVVEAPTALQELVHRRQVLEDDPRATGRDWLALARWARDHGLQHGAREAALTAAALEPHLGGLEELLGPAGFAFDQEQGDWVRVAELMARRGYVLSQGQWIPLEVHQEVQRAELERRRHLAETALLEAQRRQIENPPHVEERPAEIAPEEHGFAFLPWGQQVFVVVGTSPFRGRVRPPLAHPPGHGFDALVDRAPGSLIGVGRGVPPTGSSSRR